VKETADIHAVTPVYNNAATLAGCVRSLLAEPRIARVHLVDDGSTDGGCAGLQLNAVEWTRVLMVRQENAGPSAARNRGIEAALTDASMRWVVFLDADDALEPGGIPAMLGRAEHAVGAGEGAVVAIVGGRYEVVDGDVDGRVLHLPPEAYRDRALPHRGVIFEPARFFGTSGALVARAALEAGVRFDPNLRIGEDRDFLYRVAETGVIIAAGTAALNVAIHRGGVNLTGPAQLGRWLRDQLTLAERYASDADAAAGLRDSCAWLIGHASRVLAKQGERVDDEVWDAYVRMFEEQGWSFPGRAWKWRYVMRPWHRLRRRISGSEAAAVGDS
jgi:glycosyltransferase involved in cell wall biosynthesis